MNGSLIKLEVKDGLILLSVLKCACQIDINKDTDRYRVGNRNEGKSSERKWEERDWHLYA